MHIMVLHRNNETTDRNTEGKARKARNIEKADKMFERFAASHNREEISKFSSTWR
jgi:hypothetical protein